MSERVNLQRAWHSIKRNIFLGASPTWKTCEAKMIKWNRRALVLSRLFRMVLRPTASRLLVQNVQYSSSLSLRWLLFIAGHSSPFRLEWSEKQSGAVHLQDHSVSIQFFVNINGRIVVRFFGIMNRADVKFTLEMRPVLYKGSNEVM